MFHNVVDQRLEVLLKKKPVEDGTKIQVLLLSNLEATREMCKRFLPGISTHFVLAWSPGLTQKMGKGAWSHLQKSPVLYHQSLSRGLE